MGQKQEIYYIEEIKPGTLSINTDKKYMAATMLHIARNKQHFYTLKHMKYGKPSTKLMIGAVCLELFRFACVSRAIGNRQSQNLFYETLTPIYCHLLGLSFAVSE